MTDERAALVLELLGTIVQRFDGIENRLDVMAKIASTPPPAPRKAAPPPTDRTDIFTAKVSEAAGKSVQSTMDKHMAKLEADLRPLVHESASAGAKAGLKRELVELRTSLQETVEEAASADLMAMQHLGMVAGRQTDRITSWPSMWLLAGFFVSSLAGATTTLAFFVQFWPG